MTGKIKIKALPACLILLSITINMLFLPSYTRVQDAPVSPGAKSFIRMYVTGLLYREEESRNYRLLTQDKPRLAGNLPGFSLAAIPPSGNSAIHYLNYCLVSAGVTLRFNSLKIVEALHLKDGMK